MAAEVLWTVQGPITSGDIGITTTHEHIFQDARCLLADDDPSTASERHQAIALLSLADVHSRPFAYPDNLVLSDLELAISEVARFRAAGGKTIVELTQSPEMGRAPIALRDVSRATGVQIVMATGRYKALSHPPAVRDQSASGFRDQMLAEILEGVDGVRAGVIGEIGTSDEVDDVEARVLRGACEAQRTTNVALFIHLNPSARTGQQVLDLCERAGGLLDRTVACHMDSTLDDLSYARDLADRGAFVAIDVWGDEHAYPGHRMPADSERVAAVLRIFDEGWADRLLLGHDVCTKHQLHAFGGPGYDHLLTQIRPQLLAAGLSESEVEMLFVDNPRAALCGSRPPRADEARRTPTSVEVPHGDE